MKNFTKRLSVATATIISAAGLLAAGNGLLTITSKQGNTKTDDGQLLKRLGQQYTIARAMGKTPQVNLAPTRNASEAEVLVDEDFSLFAGGNESELGAHITEAYLQGEAPTIDAKYTKTPGWWGVGVYEAGGAVALAYPNYGGCINTPEGNFYGNLHIKFRAKAREGNKQPVVVFCNVLCGGMWYPSPISRSDYVTVGSKGGTDTEWHEYEFNCPIDYTGEDAYIQLNAVCYSKTGVIIDDLKVTRDYDFCMTPHNLFGHSFKPDGFTAYWQAGAENKSWLFTLIEQNLKAEGEQTYSEDFNGFKPKGDGIDETSIPEGWDIENTTLATGTGNNTSQCLALGRESMILLPTNWGYLKQLSFNLEGTKLNEDTKGELEILGFDGENWGSVASVRLNKITREGEAIDLVKELPAFANTYLAAGFATSGLADGEQIYLDNIAWSTEGAYERNTLKEDEKVTATEVTLNDLDRDAEYYFRVKGVKGDLISESSALTHAFGVCAPVLAEPTGIDKRGAYMANWEPEAKANAGYTVKNYEVRTAAADATGYEVLHETFTNAKSENGEDVYLEDGSNLDNITDTKGWSADGQVYTNDNKICVYNGILYLPELSLQNGEGEFTISFNAEAYGNEVLAVQCGNEAQSVKFEGAYTPAEGTYEKDSKHVSMTFKHGCAHTQIMIYTPAGGTFYISDLKIVQDVKQGDKFYTLQSAQDVDENTTNYRFSGLRNTADFNYAYTVVAKRELRGRKCVSDPAPDMKVNLTTSIDKIDATECADANVRVDNGAIVVRLNHEGIISLYGADGKQIARITGQKGENIIAVPAAGLYVVSAPAINEKVIVPHK